ncbi:hypothetical protein TNCV_2934071 [Trichonephila clavipes]|nr:hypothetical protein TNCV_2934071 [Trichonephila clavipes]
MAKRDDTRVPSSGRMDTYRVSLPPRWRADVPMSARKLIFQIASVFMVHQISYSIFEVGGEAIPVMPLREQGRHRNDKSAGSSSRTIRNQRGSLTNGKKMILERPLLVVWILTESACHLGGGRTCQCPPVQNP